MIGLLLNLTLFLIAATQTRTAAGSWIDLSEFTDKNLNFFQKYDKTHFYDRIISNILTLPDIKSDVDYINVRIGDISSVRRKGNVGEYVNDANLQFLAALTTDKLTYYIDRFNSTTKMGPDSVIKNAKIQVTMLDLDFTALLTPVNETCTLSVDVNLNLAGSATLKSEYEFYDNMNITKFFQETFINELNKQFAHDYASGRNHPCDASQLPHTVLNLFTIPRQHYSFYGRN